MPETAIDCEDLVQVFTSATGETHALRGVGLRIPHGEVTVVTGPSGSGKSSLLTLLGARDRPSAGRLMVLGHDVTTASTGTLRTLRRGRIGYVPQRSSGGLFPHLGALAQLEQVRLLRGSTATALEPHALLAALGLAERSDHRPGALSGGEQQRLAVAMALVGRPDLVVADEPTAELDDENAALVLDALASAAAAGSAVVVSSHDERVSGRADRLLRLSYGVLSGETAGRGVGTVVIDATGRLQLPPAVLARFPTRRVVVEVDGDEVRLRAPHVPPGADADGEEP